VENKFLVTIAPDAPVGVHEARVLSRLGISSARAFSVSNVDEVTRTAANNSVETALKLPLNTICNATMTKRAVDFYAFEGKKGQRVAVDCAATGIDSRLTPVVIIANDKGADLLVNRTGGVIDFTPPADGSYLIKVNDLTYQGGERHFYRLALREVKRQRLPHRSSPRPPASVPSPGRRKDSRANAPANEVEPNNDKAKDAKKVTLPLDVAGSFFSRRRRRQLRVRGEERRGLVGRGRLRSGLGRQTDPFVLVQRVAKNGEKLRPSPTWPSFMTLLVPVKVSTNGYSYDGPPYDVGSPDVLGKVEIKQDGLHRLSGARSLRRHPQRSRRMSTGSSCARRSPTFAHRRPGPCI
jgi:hypothetical protein